MDRGAIREAVGLIGSKGSPIVVEISAIRGYTEQSDPAAQGARMRPPFTVKADLEDVLGRLGSVTISTEEAFHLQLAVAASANVTR
jgi:hypothetical protein